MLVVRCNRGNDFGLDDGAGLLFEGGFGFGAGFGEAVLGAEGDDGFDYYLLRSLDEFKQMLSLL